MAQGTRMADLETRFTELAGSLANTAEKQAISILHAMIQEVSRQGQAPPGGEGDGGGSANRFDEIANLYKSAPGMQGRAENTGLPVGSQAPEFTLPDGQGRPVSLTDYRGMNVLLVFYPLDWSPACSDQLALYQAELADFESHNTQVIGISVDSLYSHGAWAAVRGISFPLLADFHPKGRIAQQYQVLRGQDGFSERALFLIDSSGVIRYTNISPEIHQIPDIYRLFAEVSAVGTEE